MKILERPVASNWMVAVAALTLTSCTVVVDEPRPLPPEPGPILCTREYAPVCAQSGGQARSFGNACEARASGYRIIHAGQCRTTAPRPDACTMEYAPVCARRGGHVRTFGNACSADREGYRILYAGRC